MWIIKNIKNNVYLEVCSRGLYHFGLDKENALKFKHKREIDKIFKNDKFEIIEVN